jgi:ATP-dependent DNA helicase UvrD/PcrA
MGSVRSPAQNPSAPDFATDLNDDQLAAVTHGDGPQLVLAGAGSGKTRVITYRVSWLIRERGVEPDAVVAVTFTNKAAAEMRERIEQLLGIFPLPTFVGTFHRFALTLLRRWGERVGVEPGFAIFDRDDQIAMVKSALEAEGLSESSYPPRSVLAAISAAKNQLRDPDAYEKAASGFFEQRVARVYRRYQGLLQRSSGVDFDDMLRLAVRLVTRETEIRERLRRSIRYLLVDEFQDTNHAQMRLIHELVGEGGNLTAVGDEDQGIYRWRGADLENVLAFEKSYPGATIRKLERNYRSTQNILTAAGDLVARNERRRGKRLWTDAGDGEKIELYKAGDEQDEARWITRTLQDLRGEHVWSSMAVLVRTNAQTRALEERFLREEIPYELVGGVRFYERAEIKDLVAYLRVLRNPRDDFSLSRVLNQPPRGIGRSTREMLEQMAAERQQPLWDALVHLEPASWPARSAKALTDFREIIEGLQGAAEELPLPALLDRLLERTQYVALYDKPDAENQARLENIREFLTAAQEFTEEEVSRGEEDALTAFLDHASLVADIDQWQADRGVSLMTLHSAKGLEFPVVVVAGLEDGLLPHFNSMGVPESIEEERRLLYVGMTRAERRLFLTACRRRRIAGRYQDQNDSMFLGEIPSETLIVHRSPELFRDARTRGVRDFFGSGRSWQESPRAPQAEASSSDGSLRRGRRVRHPTLGDGVVLEQEGQGDNSKLTVYFDRFGKRRLVARYAGLEVL